MGNSHANRSLLRHKNDVDGPVFSPPSILPSEPGRPVVRLSEIDTNDREGGLTDEIVLKWKPPSRKGNVDIQGYLVEMWDLGMSEWVRVVGTDDPNSNECRLSNILSGMLYRFRVSAVTEAGLSLPSLPSDAFVVNIPGVHIAPYWVTTPDLPQNTLLGIHDTLHLRVEALGTPTPNFRWYKDDEEIFLADGVSIVHSENASELIVENLQPDDAGILRCSAVNTIGRTDWDVRIILFATPEFDTSVIKRKYRFKTDEIIRIKCPLIAIPEPTVKCYRRGQEDLKNFQTVHVVFSEDRAIFKIDSASPEHSGIWVLEAENVHGKSAIELNIKVDCVPTKPSQPEVLVRSNEVELSWAHDGSKKSEEDPMKYLVEYYRDQWALWLKARYSESREKVVVSDLIPNSYYKFRVKAINSSGVSEPSDVSESIILRGDEGEIEENEEDPDILSGLPESNFSRQKSQNSSFRKNLKFASLFDVSENKLEDQYPRSNRQQSLEREVYYDKDVRKEVVTYYRPTLHKKCNMTSLEEERYKRSMTDLCAKLLRVSSTSLYNDPQQVPSSKEKMISVSSNNLPSVAKRNDLDPPYRYSLTEEVALPIRPPRKQKKKRGEKSNVERRIERRNAYRSMTELRGRISSLQNILLTKRDDSKRKEREKKFSTSAHSLSFFLESEDKIRPVPKVVSVQNLAGVIETHFLVDSDDKLDESYNDLIKKNEETDEEEHTLINTNDSGATSKTLIADDNHGDTDFYFSSLDLD